MPLIKGKSPESFKHNIKAEMHAGKPLKQSLAIAYAMKKRAKMADGGMTYEPSMHKMEEEDTETTHDLGEAHSVYADGDIVGRVMHRRYSEGGRVANEGEDELSHLADGAPNEFDDLALDDHLESHNSGADDGDFLGNEQEDHDRADIISKIMKQRSMKQRNPRPA